MNVYEEAYKSYIRIIHLTCILSTAGIIIFTLLEWYILVGIFLYFAFQGIKRLRWINKLEALAVKEGFNVAEFIFKDLEDS